MHIVLCITRPTKISINIFEYIFLDLSRKINISDISSKKHVLLEYWSFQQMHCSCDHQKLTELANSSKLFKKNNSPKIRRIDQIPKSSKNQTIIVLKNPWNVPSSIKDELFFQELNSGSKSLIPIFHEFEWLRSNDVLLLVKKIISHEIGHISIQILLDFFVHIFGCHTTHSKHSMSYRTHTLVTQRVLCWVVQTRRLRCVMFMHNECLFLICYIILWLEKEDALYYLSSPFLSSLNRFSPKLLNSYRM